MACPGSRSFVPNNSGQQVHTAHPFFPPSNGSPYEQSSRCALTYPHQRSQFVPSIHHCSQCTQLNAAPPSPFATSFTAPANWLPQENALRRQIASLETQLAQVKAEKLFAMDLKQQLARSLAEKDSSVHADSHELTKLAYKLGNAKGEISRLKAMLQAALLLSGQPFRDTATNSTSATLNDYQPASSKTATPRDGVGKHEGPEDSSLIDLIDSRPSSMVGSSSEFNHSESSVSESDNDEQPIKRNSVFPPSTLKWHANKQPLQNSETFPSESSHVRHFFDESTGTSGKLATSKPMDTKTIPPNSPIESLPTLFNFEDSGLFITGSRPAQPEFTATNLRTRLSSVLETYSSNETESSMQDHVVEAKEPDDSGQDLSRRLSASGSAICPKWNSTETFNKPPSVSPGLDAIGNFHGPDIPEFFKFGIRFIPNLAEQNIYRAVTIDGLPSDVTLTEVLAKVRGGILISAYLLDTSTISKSSPFSNSSTALITFLQEYAAINFKNNACRQPIILRGSTARVEVIPTPTWPVKISMRVAMMENRRTRCFNVKNFNREVSYDALYRDLRVSRATRSNPIEHMLLRKDNVLELRFTSVKAADMAYGVMTRYPAYRQCSVEYISDPCALPLDTTPLNMENPRFAMHYTPLSSGCLTPAATCP